MINRKKWNKYPYLILLIVHSLLLLYTFIKSSQRKPLLVLLFSNMGMAYIFDYIILSFIRAYKYKPKFFRNKFLDNVTGAILSQAIYVPFTALFITAFKLNWKYKLFFAFYFSVIEKIFIHFGIFKKMGWRTTYTFVLIFIYFFISDKWLELLKKGDTFIQKITLYNMVHFTSINSLFVLEVPRILTFGRGVFHSLKEQLKGEPLYASMMSIIKTWATLNGNISIKMIVFFIKILMDNALRKLNLIQIPHIFPLTVIDIFLLTISNIYKRWIDEIAENQQ